MITNPSFITTEMIRGRLEAESQYSEGIRWGDGMAVTQSSIMNGKICSNKGESEQGEC